MPTRLTPDACLARIADGDVAPVYFVVGPDLAQKTRLLDAFSAILEEDLRPFNFDRLHAAESKADLRRQVWMLLDLARTLPMLAPRRIVAVSGAEKLLGAIREAEGASDELDALEAYLKQPEPHATLVLVTAGDPDRRSKPVALLEKYAVVVNCDPLEGAGDAVAWVKGEAAAEGVRIEPAAARLLARLAGSDIQRLRAEFERALLFAAGDGVITEDAVQQVASAATSQDQWAMTTALQEGRAGEALRELALKLDAGEPPVMVLGQLAWFVRARLSPPRLGPALDALLRTDLALKRSGGDPRVLLERLVVELCG